MKEPTDHVCRMKRLTELVLERPLMSEACVRQEYNKRREWGQVGVVQVAQALSRWDSLGIYNTGVHAPYFLLPMLPRKYK